MFSLTTDPKSTGLRVAPIALAACMALMTVGCGGSASSPIGGPRSTPVPATSVGYQVYEIIGLSKVRLGIAVAGSTLVAPPGYSVGPVVPQAVITYPNGTTQVADANGVFQPSSSQYASPNQELLETSTETQPLVKVQAPAFGSAFPVSASVAGYAAASIVNSHARHPMDATSAVSLAGVRTLPGVVYLNLGDIAILQVVGIDVDDHVASLQNATIAWSTTSGIVTPVPGTNMAYYTAPSAPVDDTVVATVTLGSTGVAYRSTSLVRTLDPSVAFHVSGVISTAAGVAIPNGTALFQLDEPARNFPGINWFAVADSSGAFSVPLPPELDFELVIGAPANQAPGGATNFYPAVLTGTTNGEFSTGAPGGSAVTNLSINGSGGFDDLRDDASNAIPPPVNTTRDAWFATAGALRPLAYDADSGLQVLLASPPPLSSLPFPATPTLVNAGTFAFWCYQWVNIGGVATLAVVENTNSLCSAPGNSALAIVPPAAPGGAFAFSAYTLPSGTYSLSSPLNPTPPGARVTLTGTWTQTLTFNGPAIVGDTANVRLSYFGNTTQSLTSPEYSESYAYAYSRPGSLATINFTNESLADPTSGTTLQSYQGTKTQLVSLNGAGGCVTPTSQIACYSVGTTGTRFVRTSVGTISLNFSTSDTYFGDGAAAVTFANTNAGNGSKVKAQIASDAARTTGNCVVCPAAPGSLFDTDGITDLAGFTVDSTGSVTLDLLDTAPGGPPGKPVDVLNFVL